ncbi:MAG: ATP-binding protein, partial [Chitinophagaceae bacterium]|nr:ATP-binding protein [Chitinophagaceae bacterium]
IAHKRKVGAGKTWVKVGVSEVSLFSYPGSGQMMMVTFEQDYRSNNLSEVTEYAFKNNDKDLRATAAEYLGLIYSIFQSSTQSTEYFNDALAMRQKLNDDKGCLRISEQLFELHYKDKRFDSALWFSRMNESMAAKLSNTSSFHHSIINQVFALIRLRRFTDAQNVLTTFSPPNNHGTDINIRLRFQIAWGNYYLTVGEREKALTAYEKAIKLASTTNTPDQTALVYGHMSESYAQLGDFQTAYDYGQKYFELMKNFYRNSITELSKLDNLLKEDVTNSEILYLSSINKLKELRFLRELELTRNLQEEAQLKDSILQKEKLLSAALERENTSQSKELISQQQMSDYLKLESTEQQKKLRAERRVRIILIVGVFALVTLGAVTLHQYRGVKSKKEIIQRQANDLQVLMKEIHHRVKNNLQIISSLLDIQSLNLTDKQAVEAIKEGRNRVQSMAILHQHLYHEENIRGIIMPNYIANLAENLFASYNINPDKISLKTDIEKLNLDVDTVIPLGLVINELVSNSLKYAFKNGQHGSVYISLKEKDNGLELVVKDSGQGYPVGMDSQQDKTFGLQLIQSFARKLKATLNLYNDNGAVASLQIKKIKFA